MTSGTRVGPVVGAVDVDLPALVAAAEERGIPVLRTDRRGDQHLIRSLDELHRLTHRKESA